MKAPKSRSGSRLPARPGAVIAPAVGPPARLAEVFDAYQRSADDWIDDPDKCAALVRQVREKLAEPRSRRGPLGAVWEEAQSMVRLVEARAAGDAPQLARSTVRQATAALLYLVLPDDLVADSTPKVGLMDDAAIIGLVAERIGPQLRGFGAGTMPWRP